MRPATELAKLEEWTRRRVAKLRFIKRNGANDRSPLILPFVVLELDNVILNLFQSYVISCLARRPIAVRSGKVVSTFTFSSAEAAMAFALSNLNFRKFRALRRPTVIGQRDWPRSREPKDWEKVLISAGCSILPSFQNALALNAGVFSRIGAVRNFYAHRNGSTAQRVVGIARTDGVIPVHHPDEYCLAIRHGAATPNIDQWFSEVEIFAQEMVA
jgi:hypothetical protein